MPHTLSEDAHRPVFASVVCNDGRYRLYAPDLDEPTYQSDTVNAACDLAGLISRQSVWGREDRLGLHAAAVALGDSLVVFPAGRRAGKSVLTMALAEKGAIVFSDDVLPINVTPAQPIRGIAQGISPRVRLPLPRHPLRLTEPYSGLAFIENSQYRYIAVPSLATIGEELPVGAFVQLERRNGGEAFLEPTPGGLMLGTLLRQNFGLGADAERLLVSLHRLCLQVPSFRLTYADPIEASELLLTNLGPRLAVSAPLAPQERPRNNLHSPLLVADDQIDDLFQGRPEAPVAVLDGEFYAASPDNDRIIKLNDTMVGLWTLLANPISPREAAVLMGTAFQGVAADQIAMDVRTGFAELGKAGLIQRAN